MQNVQERNSRKDKMPTPATGYFVNGTKVPGTTTIIGRFKDSGALIYWAWSQGREGKDFRETVKSAGDAGTLAHAMVEADLKGAAVNAANFVGITPEVKNNALQAFKAYESWKKQTKLKVVSLETPLTSAEYMFGGTPDGIVETGGNLAIVDIKTGSGVYRDALLQVAAYAQLWEETNPGQKIKGGFHILRFAKEAGDFAHHFFPNLDEAWDMFLLLRKAYDIDLKLKKRAS
jgi:hypothetical protein